MGLIERDAELAALSSHWTRARAGSGGVVLVSAESGGGKTAVVDAFARSLMSQAPVLWGSCDPLHTPRPLGPLFDLRDRFGARTRELLEGAGQAHEIHVALYDDLRTDPCVLVVDDLHWADQGTIDVLRFLLRRVVTTRTLVVGTLRPDEIDASHPLRTLLGDAARSPDAVALELRPLSAAGVRTLVDDRPVDAERLHSLTGGNPFFVNQMLDHQGDELPATVRDAILARTVDLEDAARDLLDLLVCAPEAIPDRLLPQLGIGVAPLRSLHRAGLIRRSPRGVSFRHDLHRQAIAGSIPPGGETTLHLRMLEALEASGSVDPAVLVHHARGAGDSERLLRYASSAGRAAARTGAHTQAAEFFALALEHGDPATSAVQAELLEQLATESYLLDRLDDAIRACRRAIRLREASGDVAHLSTDYQALSVYEWYHANREAADRHASEAVSVLGPGGARNILGHAISLQAYLALQASDVHRAHLYLEQARTIAGEVHDPQLSTRIELLEGIERMVEGADGARDQILRVVEPGADDFNETLSSGYSNLVYLDVEHRRLSDALDVLEVSLPLTVEWDMPICHVWQMGARGRLHLIKGDWDAAEADAENVLAAPSAPLARTWPHVVRGLVRLRRTADPGSHLDDAWELAHRFGEPLRLLPAAAAIVEQVWLTGVDDPRIDEAIALLREFHVPGLEWARGELAVWLRRLDPAIDVDGLVVSTPHQLQLSGEHISAASAWELLDAPYERALSLVETAEREELRRGLGLLDRLGADSVAAKLRRDLRERGVSNVPARPRSATLVNAAGLTAREVEVLALLGEGLSNAELATRLYISPKTADHHVSAILSKLQVRDRRQAVRAGRRLGLLG